MRAWLVLFLLVSAGCSDEARSGAAGSAGAAGASGGSGHAGASAGMGAGGQNGSAGSKGLAGASAGGADPTGGTAGNGGASCPNGDTNPRPWPGGAEVKTLDMPAWFNGNLSGLAYEPKAGASPAVLWAVSNIPGKLYRLLVTDAGISQDAAQGWAQGKPLHFLGGAGELDSESVTFTGSSADGVYVASEHDNDAATTSRLSIVRFDVSGSEAELSATAEWNVTAALPPVGANLGIEAITWVSDAYLTSKGFYDEAKQQVYAPADYPDHGAGLFFVGVEETGKVHGFALQGQGSFALLATIDTPLAGVMGLEHDRDVGYLWAYCDAVCGNRAALLDIDTTPGSPTLGHFVPRYVLERPSGMADSDTEGIAIAPESACQDGVKPFFWADDADLDGYSVREGTLRCGGCL